MSTFSIRLKTLRKRKGETQDEISELLKIRRNTFSGYERGIILPPYEKIRILADHYKVSIDYLMGKSNDENFDIKSEDTIPDVYQQLMIISNELLSDTSIIKCKGKIIDNEEKKQIEFFIENVAKYIDAIMKK